MLGATRKVEAQEGLGPRLTIEDLNNRLNEHGLLIVGLEANLEGLANLIGAVFEHLNHEEDPNETA